MLLTEEQKNIIVEECGIEPKNYQHASAFVSVSPISFEDTNSLLNFMAKLENKTKAKRRHDADYSQLNKPYTLKGDTPDSMNYRAQFEHQRYVAT